MNKLLLACSLLLLSCSTGQINQKVILADDLFKLKNLMNSSIVSSFKYQDDRLFSDSTYRTEFVPLDSTLKRKILAPIMKRDLGVDPEYSERFILSHFISKQETIGKYQPIIIYSTGDDYKSLMLVIIDSTINPISHLVISGGQFGGPYEVNDSLTSWGEETISRINNNEINSYISKTYVWSDARNDTAFIDSLVFLSKIRDNGTIETILLDSLRIRRKII